VKKLAGYSILTVLCALTIAYVAAIPILAFGAAAGSMEQGDSPVFAFSLMLGFPLVVLAILWGIGLAGLKFLRVRSSV